MSSQPDFDGVTYERAKDHARLTSQLVRVYGCMRDGQWRTLDEIARSINDPAASISARLRDLRKSKFGGYTVQRRRRTQGLFEYRLALGQIDWIKQ